MVAKAHPTLAARPVSVSGGRSTGVYCGDGASIGHRLGRDYEAGYTGPQELQRYITAKAPNPAGTSGLIGWDYMG